MGGEETLKGAWKYSRNDEYLNSKRDPNDWLNLRKQYDVALQKAGFPVIKWFQEDMNQKNKRVAQAQQQISRDMATLRNNAWKSQAVLPSKY